MIVYLYIEQVELDRIARVDILVRIEELPSQKQYFALLDTLLPKCPTVIQPVHYQSNISLALAPNVMFLLWTVY